jgi:hypothetical protein
MVSASPRARSRYFHEQDNKGIGVWRGQFSDLRTPKPFNLRADPVERSDESTLHEKWIVDHLFAQIPAQALVARWLESFVADFVRSTDG